MMNLKLLGRRKELGLTQQQLADKIPSGVFVTDIGRIENGWIPPDAVKAALAVALETTVDAIFDAPTLTISGRTQE